MLIIDLKLFHNSPGPMSADSRIYVLELQHLWTGLEHMQILKEWEKALRVCHLYSLADDFSAIYRKQSQILDTGMSTSDLNYIHNSLYPSAECSVSNYSMSHRKAQGIFAILPSVLVNPCGLYTQVFHCCFTGNLWFPRWFYQWNDTEWNWSNWSAPNHNARRMCTCMIDKPRSFFSRTLGQG